ncbi:hypothetical protein B0T24DRAFT_676474 [Lasiosphaeria ovina]|uniref:Uncharacterized protein n=1 Tax=Lasiosphaeria ovina TaxID=92902 RepID=A0AAE0KFG0_9PEZI|nr:hypothetical protein B0T24DRAFT_676474 [Lasiosphaeria ovina]
MAGNMDEIRKQVNDAIASSGSRIIGMIVDAGRASQIRREDLQDIKLKLDDAKTRRVQVPPAGVPDD